MLRFSLDQPLEQGTVLVGGWIVSRAPGRADVPVLPVSEVQLIGRHLLSDVAAATTIALLAGAAPDAIRAAVAGFRGLEHALELVRVVAGITFVNDSKATNVESARRAIESFDGRLVPIIGGKFKGGNLRDLRPALQGRSTAVVAIGEARPVVREALGGHGGGDRGRIDGRSGAGGRSARRRREARCSWRRRARVSTCSATTRNAAGSSSRKWQGSRRSWIGPVSREQSSVGMRD